jgi:hypothetical protein
MSAGILLLALAACGQKQVGFGGQQGAPMPQSGSAGPSVPSKTQPAPPQEQPPRDAHTPERPPGSKVVPPAQVDSAALPRDYPQGVWTDADGRTLGLVGQEGGCGRVHAELGQQSSTVRVTFVQVQVGGEMCTMDIRFVPLRVTLDAPLGDRVVVLTLAQQ